VLQFSSRNSLLSFQRLEQLVEFARNDALFKQFGTRKPDKQQEYRIYATHQTMKQKHDLSPPYAQGRDSTDSTKFDFLLTDGSKKKKQ